MRFVFLHRDLEIGGAQRLILDVALALRKLGHDVRILTSTYDPNFAFPESKLFQVKCVGNFLPTFQFFGFYLRMIYLSLWLCFYPDWEYDAVFIDQFAYGIPFIKWFGRKNTKIMFYCHFPDKLLAAAEKTIWIDKNLFHPFFWDPYEEYATSLADVIMTNSEYTTSQFYKAYKSLKNKKVHLLYPCLNNGPIQNCVSYPNTLNRILSKQFQNYFLSLNRFDTRKNIQLAVHAFGRLRDMLPESQFDKFHLVIAGSINKNLADSTRCYDNLVKLVNESNLTDQVSFITTPPDELKWKVLSNCLCLLYTPINEHFGITPLEAMYCGKPVIALRSGGVKETVKENKTGFLAEPGESVDEFSRYMLTFVKEPKLADSYGKEGSIWVREKFSHNRLLQELERIVNTEVQS